MYVYNVIYIMQCIYCTGSVNISVVECIFNAEFTHGFIAMSEQLLKDRCMKRINYTELPGRFSGEW